MFHPTTTPVAWDSVRSRSNSGSDTAAPDDPLSLDASSVVESEPPTDPLVSTCDVDSKTTLLLHLETLSQKSPKKKSPRKKIKMRESHKLISNDNSVDDEEEEKSVVRNLMNDIVDKIEEEQQQPGNLVFSTLGRSNERESSDVSSNSNQDDENDDISAYLESSREASPERVVEEEIYDENNEEDYSQMSSDFEMTPTKLRSCKVGVERMQVSEEDMVMMKDVLMKRKKKKMKNQCKVTRSLSIKGLRNRNGINQVTDKTKLKKKIMLNKKKKMKRCFKCEACQLPDCRKCVFCKDMKKYGGKGVKKQSCEMRPKCLFLENNKMKLKKKIHVPKPSIPKPSKTKDSIKSKPKPRFKSKTGSATKRKTRRRPRPVHDVTDESTEDINSKTIETGDDDVEVIHEHKIEKKSFMNLSREELIFGVSM